MGSRGPINMPHGEQSLSLITKEMQIKPALLHLHGTLTAGSGPGATVRAGAEGIIPGCK